MLGGGGAGGMPSSGFGLHVEDTPNITPPRVGGSPTSAAALASSLSLLQGEGDVGVYAGEDYDEEHSIYADEDGGYFGGGAKLWQSV